MRSQFRGSFIKFVFVHNMLQKCVYAPKKKMTYESTRRPPAIQKELID